MAQPNNILQQVRTYQLSELAYLQNLYCFISTSNKKFKDFEKLTANLGDTVTFDLPPRFLTQRSLVVNFQPANQRVHTLTVDKSVNTSYAFTNQQYIFNVEDYMEKFGKAAIQQLGASIESDVASICATAPYRFYGDGVNQISTYQDLAMALAQLRNYGSVTQGDAEGYLSDIAVPGIVNSGLSQFAMNRNDELANSWEIGEFSRCKWYSSNLLPIHIAGSEGQGANNNLTVVSTTLDSAGAVIAITVENTLGTNDPDCIKKYDRIYFQDNVSGFDNMRYLTFIGQSVSSNAVQFLATADASSNGSSQVTIPISPALQANATSDQNINQAIQAGMKIKVLPSHRAGMITSGKPLFLGMPRLPEEEPFPTANEVDMETGCSFRHYYGSLFGQNQRGTVRDAIYGYTMPGENALALIFKL